LSIPAPPRKPSLFTLPWLVLLLLACESQEPVQEEPGDEVPQQVLWDFSTSESDSGRLSWMLKGRQAFLYESTPQVRAKEVRIWLYDGRGAHSSMLAADSAYMDRRGGKGDMTALGNVYVLSRNGAELWTSELTWMDQERVFRSDSFVQVREGADLHSGFKVSCDEHLGRLWIDSLPRHEIVAEEGDLP